MKLMKLMHSAMFLSCLLSFGGLDAKEYPVYKISRVPEIDGRLDDHAWKKLPEGRGFIVLKKDAPYAKERTTKFKMGYRGDCLYVAVECDEPDLKKLKAVDTYRDGWSMDDAVELFFLPRGSRHYMQLMANAKGARWSKLDGAERETEPPMEWKVAAGRTDRSWTLEMAIPVKFLGAVDIDGIRFNIGRNMPGGVKEKHACWADVIRGYGDSARFAQLAKQDSNGPADVELESHELNRKYDTWLYLRLREIAVKGRSYKELETRFSEAPDFDNVRMMQKKIAGIYQQLPKSEYAALYRDWENTVAKISIPRCSIEFSVQKKGMKNLKFQVNDAPVAAENGRYRFSLEEGVTTLCMSAEKASGESSLKFDFKNMPELNRRWAYSAEAPRNWTDIRFDDRNWKPMPERFDSDKIYLRQAVIWNRKHDGRFRCINPSIHNWGFSLDSTEPLYLSLYSPTGLKVNSYEFILDLPAGFRLLDMEPGARRNRLSIAPRTVKSEPATLDGKPFTRYTLQYADSDIDEWRTADSILGIYKDGTGKAGDKGGIHYSRRINGNVTEITGTLPYHILPRINGGKTKHMVMSFYMGAMPQGMSREMTSAFIRDAVRAGVDIFSLYPGRSLLNDLVTANGGTQMFGYLNHPIWGARVKDGGVMRLFRKHPDLYAEYFTGKRRGEEDRNAPAHTWKFQFCPSLVLSRYKAEFSDAVKEDYRNFFFKAYPDAKYVFLNWEQEPWTGSVYEKSSNPENAFCFCGLCKENFRKWAKLPADADLSNQTIFKNYYEPWRKFRYSQDAGVHRIVVDAIRSLGKQVMFYSWSNHFGYWEAAEGIPYTVFLGCPGNGTADRRQQISMDEYMKFHKGKMKRSHIVGQRFVFFPQTYGWNTEQKEGWLKFNVMSDDGYVHPETWKGETLRILATLQGGLDFQNPLEMVGGIKYYVGEATRIIAKYENLFYYGKRNDKLAVSKEIAYPDLLVLEHDGERLVLLFNESGTPKQVTVKSTGLLSGQKGKACYSGRTFDKPENITLTVPANDVEVIHIK